MTKFIQLPTFTQLSQRNENCNPTGCPTGKFTKVRACQMITDRAISQVSFTMKFGNSFLEICLDSPIHLMTNELMDVQFQFGDKLAN